MAGKRSTAEHARASARGFSPGPVTFQDAIEVDVVPSSVSPEHRPGGPLMAIARLFVDPLHGRIERMPIDAVQAELGEREAGAHGNRVGGVAATPGGPVADH